MIKWIVIVLLCLAVTAGAQERAFVMLPPQIAALTVCTESNVPLFLIDREYQNSPEVIAELVAHEMVHARQMRNYPNGGCRAMQRRYAADVQYRFETEFEAYCINAARDVVLRGQDAEFVAHNFSEFMARIYPEQAPIMPILLARARVCIARGILPPLTGSL